MPTDPLLQQAINEIRSTYGVDVSTAQKQKSLLKFGRNENVGTGGATIMDFAGAETDETYVSTNAITHIASSSTSDTEVIRVEGHTIDGNGDLTFTVQSVTLAGQTKTPLSTPLARATRAYNAGSANLVGTVYVAEDVTFTSGVPQTASAVHVIIPAGKNQSRKASTAISAVDFWIVTNIYADVLEKTAASADVDLQVREKGGVFRQVATLGVASDHQGRLDFVPPLIIPANSDVRLRATASASSTDVSGGIQGYLASVKTEETLFLRRSTDGESAAITLATDNVALSVYGDPNWERVRLAGLIETYVGSGRYVDIPSFEITRPGQYEIGQYGSVGRRFKLRMFGSGLTGVSPKITATAYIVD